MWVISRLNVRIVQYNTQVVNRRCHVQAQAQIQVPVQVPRVCYCSGACEVWTLRVNRAYFSCSAASAASAAVMSVRATVNRWAAALRSI